MSLVILALAPVLAWSGPAEAAGSLYDVDKIIVDVTADNAVAAQKKAMAQAQAKGADILFRRLVPPQMHDRLPKLSQSEAEALVTGVSIGRERYSTTRYIASLGVSYSQPGVQQLLASYGLPIDDARAPEIKIMPVFLDSTGAPQTQGDEIKAWTKAWDRVDVSHAIAPAKLVKATPELTAERLQAMLGGDIDSFDYLESQVGGGPLVVAIAELRDGAFSTRLFGVDAASDIDTTQSAPIDGKVTSAANTAAEQSFATIQQRWKSMQAGGQAAMPGGQPQQNNGGNEWWNFNQQQPQQQPAARPQPRKKKRGWFNFGGRDEEPVQQYQPPQYIVATVEFGGIMGWPEAQSRLANVPGIQRLQVGAMSPEGASITFDYAGSLGTLQQDLAQNGFTFESGQGGYVLRPY